MCLWIRVILKTTGLKTNNSNEMKRIRLLLITVIFLFLAGCIGTIIYLGQEEEEIFEDEQLYGAVNPTTIPAGITWGAFRSQINNNFGQVKVAIDTLDQGLADAVDSLTAHRIAINQRALKSDLTAKLNEADSDKYITPLVLWTGLAGKQDTFSLKTINNQTLFGTGNIFIEGGEGGTMTWPSSAGIPLYNGVSGWGTSITNNSANWNTAYSWGNHASAGYLTSQISHDGVVVDGDFTSQGIMLRGTTSGTYSILANNSSNWNTAYGWGDHANAGYYVGGSSTIRNLFSSSATGLTYTSSTGAFSLTTGYVIPATVDVTNWNTAYNWGNHASAGYFIGSSTTIRGLFSSTATGLTYSNSTGVLSLASGYGIPTTTSMTNWDFAYEEAIDTIPLTDVALRKHPLINTQTGTSYVLVLADDAKIVTMTNSSANTLTVPPNASVAFPPQTQITIVQTGTGQTTITAGSGVTIRSAGAALKMRLQYSSCTLIKIGTDEWLCIGDITT